MPDLRQEILGNMEQALEKKMRELSDAAQRQIDSDREKVKQALSYIDQNMVFKRVSQLGWPKKYQLATVEMFYEDYFKKEGCGWEKGVNFYPEGERHYRGVFSVNGEDYYDMRYLLERYEKDVKEVAEKATRWRDKVHEIQKELDEAVSAWPAIKKVIEHWNSICGDDAHV